MDTVSPYEPWSYALQLPHDPRAPRVARMTLRAVLVGHGMSELLDTAELLTSELVTNAYQHADGPKKLRARHLGSGRLHVSVWDANPTIPAPFDKPSAAVPSVPDLVPADQDGGRGLLLVQLCADDWGGHPLSDGLFGRSGKLLWFELRPRPELARAA